MSPAAGVSGLPSLSTTPLVCNRVGPQPTASRPTSNNATRLGLIRMAFSSVRVRSFIIGGQGLAVVAGVEQAPGELADAVGDEAHAAVGEAGVDAAGVAAPR